MGVEGKMFNGPKTRHKLGNEKMKRKKGPMPKTNLLKWLKKWQTHYQKQGKNQSRYLSHKKEKTGLEFVVIEVIKIKANQRQSHKRFRNRAIAVYYAYWR